MDPKKPPTLGITGFPSLGRGEGLQPQEPAVGRSRGLLLSAEGPGIGRARGFPTLGDPPHGRGVTLPITDPVFGRARGLLSQAGDSKVGVARGSTLPSLGPLHGQTPPHETTKQDLTDGTSALTRKEVGTKSVFYAFRFSNALFFLPFLTIIALHERNSLSIFKWGCILRPAIVSTPSVWIVPAWK